MLAGISTICFFASYSVALLVELSRLFFRAQIWLAVVVIAAVAGLVAHSVYLWLRIQQQWSSRVLLSSWHDWCLLVAWLLMLAYVVLALRKPATARGVFLLPLVLTLIGVAQWSSELAPFSRSEAQYAWAWIHGVTLLLGTVVVLLGFAAGVMYLVQSYRLKHKMLPQQGLALPSLERLQTENERALIVSSVLLIAGLAAGIVYNLMQASVVAWNDPVVCFSAGLLIWLAASLTFNSTYKPARRGRKVAYLTVASFVILALVLAMVLLAEHGGQA